MCKIGEQKVIEAYLKDKLITVEDVNQAIRVGYIAGYDQAMQDFLEKACEWLKENSESYVRFDEVGYRFYAYNSLIKCFKNYMQDEM